MKLDLNKSPTAILPLSPPDVVSIRINNVYE